MQTTLTRSDITMRMEIVVITPTSDTTILYIAIREDMPAPVDPSIRA